MARALCNLRLIHTSHNPSFLERKTERVCPPLPCLFCLSLDIRKSVCEAAFQAGSTSCSAQTQVWAAAKCLKLKLEACDERLSDLLSRPNNLQSGVLTFSLSALEPRLGRGRLFMECRVEQRSFVGAKDAKFIFTTSTNKMFPSLIFGRC